MAELVYNSVPLSFLSTHRVEFEPVYDDLTQTDYLFTKVVIDCVAVIGSVPSALGPQIPPFDAALDTNPTDTVRRVSHLLNTPRRGLTFKVGGRTLLAVVAPNGDTAVPLRDVQNGPYARAAVAQIIGTECIRIAFHVEASVVDCPEATGTPPTYLSNRWTETADYNELAMVTRSRSGRIVARADMLANADELRGIVTPPLEKDMLRTSARYTLQADGRVLAYHFMDEEQYLMPPSPAAKAEGRFTISCKDGAAMWAECYFRLQGGKTTDKSILMLRAVAIAVAKIESAHPIGEDGGYLIIGSIAEDMMANDVSVRLSARVMPGKRRITDSLSGQGTVEDGNTSGNGLPAAGAIAQPRPPRHDGKKPGLSSPENLDFLKVPSNWADAGQGRFDPGTRGSAQLLLAAAVLNDPCLRIAVQTANGQRPNQLTAAGGMTPAEIKIVDRVPDDADSYRGTTGTEKSGVYEYYDVSMRQTTDNGIMALPVGKKDADAAVIQVAAPVVRMRVEWKACKIGGPPKIPNPKLKDTNWTLTKDQIDPEQVEPIADGSVLRYQISGCYDYVCKTAKTAKLTAALPPWVDRSASSFANKPFEYADDILEPGQSSLTTIPGQTP